MRTHEEEGEAVMSVDGIIAKVRKIDELDRERSIVERLADSLDKQWENLGTMDNYGQNLEKTFKPLSHTEKKHFIRIAKTRVREIGLEIEEIRAELDEPTPSSPLTLQRKWWEFWKENTDD